MINFVAGNNKTVILDKLEIIKQEETPGVLLDAEIGLIKLYGVSIPENSTEFFKPVMVWLDTYAELPNSTTRVEIALEYFNTSTSIMLLHILQKCERFVGESTKVEVVWKVLNDDFDISEAAHDYARIVTKIPFKIQPVDVI